jgi:hypothetical protein
VKDDIGGLDCLRDSIPVPDIYFIELCIPGFTAAWGPPTRLSSTVTVFASASASTR